MEAIKVEAGKCRNRSEKNGRVQNVKYEGEEKCEMEEWRERESVGWVKPRSETELEEGTYENATRKSKVAKTLSKVTNTS